MIITLFHQTKCIEKVGDFENHCVREGERDRDVNGNVVNSVERITSIYQSQTNEWRNEISLSLSLSRKKTYAESNREK